MESDMDNDNDNDNDNENDNDDNGSNSNSNSHSDSNSIELFLDGPRNLSIVEHEDRLECLANGNPTPTYRWTGVDSKRSIEGPVFILDDKDQTVQCTTTNMYPNEIKN